MASDGKIFVGGLARMTTDEGLNKYFEYFGPVKEVQMPRAPETGEARGFAFITFADNDSANKAIQYNGGYHVIDGKQAEVKACTDRRSQYGGGGGGGGGGSTNGAAPTGDLDPKKIFVGGLPPDATTDVLTQTFAQFGTVTSAIAMMDNITQRPKGFGFVSFETEEATDAVCNQRFVDVLGKKVEVKKAVVQNQGPRTFNTNSGGFRGRGGYRGGSPYTPRFQQDYGQGGGYQTRPPRPRYPAASHYGGGAPQWSGYDQSAYQPQYQYGGDPYGAQPSNGQDPAYAGYAAQSGYGGYAYAQPGYPPAAYADPSSTYANSTDATAAAAAQYAQSQQYSAAGGYGDPSANKAPNGVASYATGYGKPPTVSGYPVAPGIPAADPAAKAGYAAAPYGAPGYTHAAGDGAEVPGSDAGKIGFSAGRAQQTYHPYRR